MKKFTVGLSATRIVYLVASVEVEARSEEAARAKVEKMIEDGEDDFEWEETDSKITDIETEEVVPTSH